MSYPREIAAESTCDEIVTNCDFAPTFLDYADVDVPEFMQGRSFRPVARGEVPDDWPQSMYYRYWMHRDSIHNVHAHYGVRTKRHKLIFYYNEDFGLAGTQPGGEPPEWELYDLEQDGDELRNIASAPDAAPIRDELIADMESWQERLQDAGCHRDAEGRLRGLGAAAQ
jgi:arylsulfatase A-like enzyme